MIIKDQKKYYQLWIAAFAFTGICFSCNITKNVPENDALYMGAKIEVKDSTVTKKIAGDIKDELLTLVRPIPNSSILGFPFKLWLYNFGGNKEKGIGAWIRRQGEPPVLASSVNIENNEALLTNRLENKGYFHANTRGDSTIKNKRATARYVVKPSVQYTINSVSFPTDSLGLASAITSTASNSFLKKGEPFNLETIKNERLRIDALLKERGYYFFNPENLLVEVDTTIGGNTVNLFVTIKPQTPREAKVTYSINNVFIYSNYNLTTAQEDTSMSNAIKHKGYFVIDADKAFKPKLFEQAMHFKPGDLYNRTDHNVSLSRLINLGVYKFVKNRFQEIPDSNKLDTYYYLTPLQKKSLSAEVTALTKSNNVTGSQINATWKNRNTFKGAEQLLVKLFGGFEVQYSSQNTGFNSFRVGGDVTFSIPRFVVPIVKIKSSSSYIPKTNINVGYEMLNRQKLYSLNSFKASYGYTWKESATKEHTLNPISINYIQPLNVTQLYLDSLKNNPALSKPIEKQFIVGGNYNFNYNQLLGSDKKTGFYFNGLLDASGNLANLYAKKGVAGTKQILGTEFSQFVKTELDTRYYRKIGSKSQLANRLIVGVGFPYGNSSSMPFIKQFFIGGNNSIRAFRSRSVGPGSYIAPNISSTGFLPDQSGDIKLEINSELRTKLFSIVEGAIFVDAGNVWLYNNDTTRSGAQFSKNFLKELAVGTGIGLRLDLTILLLRLDLAFPLRIPSLPEGQRWVTDQINFGSSDWRKQNLVFNLAIGYPF